MKSLPIDEIPTPLGPGDQGETSEALVAAQRYLLEYGYAEQDIEPGLFDKATRAALGRYQVFNALSDQSGLFTEETKLAMQRPRCSLRDLALPDAHAAAKFTLEGGCVACGWEIRRLSIEIGNLPRSAKENWNGPYSLTETLVKDEIFRAADRWNRVIRDILKMDFRFVEAGAGSELSDPVLQVKWIEETSGSFSVASGDFPPCCSDTHWEVFPQVLFCDSLPSGHFWFSSRLNPENQPKAEWFDIQTVAIHELGHVLGLHHTAPGTTMQPDKLKSAARHVVSPVNIAELRTVLANYPPKKT